MKDVVHRLRLGWIKWRNISGIFCFFLINSYRIINKAQMGATLVHMEYTKDEPLIGGRIKKIHESC